MADDPGGDINYNLNYNLTIKGQQAIEELNQILQKVEEYKAQARELLQVQPGANIAAVFESIKRAQEDAFNAIKNLPSTIPETDTAGRQAALAALAGAEQQYLVDTKALSIAQQELRKEEEASAQAAKQHYGIATSAAIEYKYQVIQAKEQIKNISTQTGLTQQQVAEGMKKAQLFDPKVITTALKEIEVEEKAAAEAAKKHYGDSSAAAQAYRQEVEKTKTLIQQLSQQTGLGKQDIGKGLVQSGQASSTAVTQALREMEQAERAAAEAAKRHYGDAGAAAQAYRQQVEQAKALIQQLGQQSGQTSKDIAAGLQKAGTFDTKVVTAALKEIEQAEKSAQEAAKRHYGDATKATEVYRQSVDAAKTQIQQLAQQSGKSFKDVAAGLKQAGAFDPKVISTALKELNQAEKEAAEAAKRHYGDAGAAAQAYRQQIEQIKTQIQTLSKQQGQSFQDIGRGLVQSGQASATQVSQALKELSQEAGGLTSTFSSLGNVGQFVFGTVLGITAVTAIRNLINVLKEAVKQGLEFQYTLFTMEVAVRGLQRMGLEATLEDWNELIESIKKQFPIFPRQQITESVSLAALMTREFGFTADQIANVVRMSAILAELTGKDLHEAVRGLTYAIGSGYFESLQRAGINISRQIVAEEALRQGYEGSYTALDQNVRALLTYQIVQRNLNAVQGDAGKIMETTAGQAKALQSSLNDLKAVTGALLLDTGNLPKRLELLTTLINSLTVSIEVLNGALKNFSWGELFSTRTEDVIGADKFERLQEVLRKMADLSLTILITHNFDGTAEAAKELYNVLLDIKGELPVEPILGNVVEEVQTKQAFVRMVEEIRARQTLIRETVQEINEIIVENEQEAAERRLDIWEDYYRDLGQMAIDHGRRLSDLEQDYQRSLDDIDVDEQRDISDENADYAYKVAEAVQDAAYRKAEAERKYREQELIAEKRFQEKMRQLREGFLFELEDALRERDARQVIRLSRQYSMRKGQLEREEDLNKDERKRRFEQELRDIEHERQERQQQLAIEHQRRLQDIALQAERERQQAALDYERKKADEALRYQQDQEDRKKRLVEQLEDLKKQTEDRINEEVAQLLKEKDVVERQLDPIAQAYEDVFGPGGRIDRALAYYRALLKSLGGGGVPGTGGGGGGNNLQMAEGGTLYADKPTTVVFGEAGPEIATFTPLNKLNKSAKEKEQISSSTSQSMQKAMSTIKLEMLLSPDLVARVVDKSLEETANVIYEIVRTRQH